MTSVPVRNGCLKQMEAAAKDSLNLGDGELGITMNHPKHSQT